MNVLNCVFVLVVAFLAVFLESTVDLVRNLLGAQIDILPALMVYTGLTGGAGTIALAAFCGGLWFDALSSNPLGISILPLFLIGFVIYQARELLLRDNPFAQLMLGFAASAFAPAMTVFLLYNLGCEPMLGWSSLWKWLVLTAGGGAATPVLFRIFSKLHETFSYQPWTQTSFRADREIKRGRA